MELRKYFGLAPHTVPPDRQSDTQVLISKLEIFSSLKEKQKKSLARLFVPRNYRGGELIIKKGDTGLGMFVIVSGRIEVFDEQDGTRIPLATLEAGHPVGEMSLLDELPRSASVQVMEDAECLLLTRESFKRIARREPEILLGIVRFIVDRLRRTNELFVELPNQTKSGLMTRTAPIAFMDDSQRTAGIQDLEGAEGSAVTAAGEEPSRTETEGPASRGDVPGLLPAALQLYSSCLMFTSSAYLLGSQEILRMVFGEEPLSQRLNNCEQVISSLTAGAEENMNERSKKVFGAFQEFMNSLASFFDR